MSQLVGELGDPGLAQALSALWYGVSSSPCEDPELGALLHLVALGRASASFRGGVAAYRDQLLRLASRLGAHALPEVECRRVFVEKGRFTGVQIAQKGNVIAGDGAAIGCALSQLSPLVAQGGRSLLRSLKKAPMPEGWAFTVAMSVRGDAVPPGATSRMVWMESAAPALEIELADPGDYGVRSDGRRVILARTLMPFTSESLDPTYQRDMAAKMVRQVSELFPFVEQHWIDVYPEFRQHGTTGGKDEMSEVYGFRSLDQVPGNLRKLRPERDQGLGSRSGIEGLFVVSDEAFPELGSFGSTVAALESVSWLAHRAGLAGPFA